MSERTFHDAPDWLKWSMTFINRVGFPVAVAIYLGYMQLTAMPKIVTAIEKMNGTMLNVQEAIKENTNVLKTWKYPRHTRED